MARRIRSQDWAATPLGPIDAWSPIQRAVVDLMLASGHAMQLAWGPARIVLYNDAYAPMLGDRHPRALGMPFRAVWHEIWDEIEPLVERTFAGETVRFENLPLTMTRYGYAEETWWTFSYSPVRDDEGAVVALLNVTAETTASARTMRAERELGEASAKLHAGDERQAFLLELNDTLRASSDPVETQRAAMRLLVERLHLIRAAYFTVGADEDSVSVAQGHEQDAIPLPERIRLSDYAPEIAAAFLAGRTLVFRDTETETQLGSDPAAYRPLGIRAWLGVPLVKDARLLAIVSVHAREPRDWTAADVQLVEDVADRTWAAVERANAEAALRESEQRYRELFSAAERRAAELRAVIESIADAVYVGDASGITLANRPALDQLGFETVDDLNRDIGVLAEEIRTRDAETGATIGLEDQPFSLALAGAPTVRRVLVRHRRTGAERIVRCSASPVVIDGRVVGAVAVNTDVTEAVRAEAALRDGQALQAFLLELSDRLRPVGDPDDAKRLATNLIGATLGVDRAFYADAVDGHWHVAPGYERDIVPLPQGPFPLTKYGDWIIDGLKQGQPLVVADMAADARFSSAERDANLALQIRAVIGLPLVKNQELVAMLVVHSSAPRVWSAGERTLLEEVAERTWASVERARVEAALRDADRSKDRFLAVLAHELRNGLAPLVYNIEIGRRSSGNAKVLHGLYERVAGQLNHMVHLVDDLLDVARISTGKVELKRELVKVRDIAALAVEASRPDIDRKRHRIAVVDESTAELVVRGDKVRLTQVVSNLLSNAAKYMQPQGQITLHMARDGEDALIAVSDAGIGISAESLPKVFELFTQVRNQQAYSGGGLGIGLSLAKELVEMHGGSVSAASDGVDRGSTFTVRLPLADARKAPDEASAEIAHAAVGKSALRVLVVDDVQDSADALAELLRMAGNEVEVAYGGAEALASVRRRRPGLVLLDLGMPGMNGFDVAHRLRDEFEPDPPMHIVALTGWAQQADREQTRTSGFDSHLAKPPSEADLQAVMEQARSAVSK